MRIGIDLGGTNVKAGLVDNNGKLLYKKSIKTNRQKCYKSVIEDMIILIDKLLIISKLNIDHIKVIGIGVPGPVVYKKGIVKECVNLGWKQINLKEDIRVKLKEQFKNKNDIKILIENDANVAAVGEYLVGIMKNSRNSIFITLGTGIGGGAILNGKLHRGKDGAALEIGHMIIGENYYDCSCGNNGCFETFASATAIIKHTKKLILDGQDTIIKDRVNEDLNKIDAKIVFECAEKGDKVANIVLDRFIKYLSIGINNIINILDLDLIVIGGGVSKGNNLFMDRVISKIKKNKLYEKFELCKIEKASLGNDAGIIGAAMLDKVLSECS